jgi:hypothetical protein
MDRIDTAGHAAQRIFRDDVFCDAERRTHWGR